jgi:hypothetical protein
METAGQQGNVIRRQPLRAASSAESAHDTIKRLFRYGMDINTEASLMNHITSSS